MTCPGTGEHGTNAAGRKRGCVCPDALAAVRRYDRQRRFAERAARGQGRLPALGTQRRLRALVAFGYTPRALAGLLGLHDCTVRRLVGEDNTKRSVQRHVAAQVDALFASAVAGLDELDLAAATANHAHQRAA